MTKRERALKSLYGYSEDEKIYKRYFELRDEPEKRKVFLDSVEDYVRKHRLFIEEYPFIEVPEFVSEKTDLPHLSIRQEDEVHIRKHDRYCPAFVHMQDFFEIMYVLSGSCNHNIDGEDILLRQGDLCFIPPYAKHTHEVFDDSVVLCIYMRSDTFDDIFFNTLRSNHILSDFFMSCLYSKNPAKRIVFSTGNDEEIQNLILEMYQEVRYPDKYSRRILNNSMPLLFLKTMRKYGDTASIDTAGKQHKASRNALRMISYINDNYRNITLESLADHFNYSVPHCSKLIRNETGVGFVAFVRRIRMNHASSLLLNTSSSVADISDMVGYENTESFIRAFQKVFNQTPGAYRKCGGISNAI